MRFVIKPDSDKTPGLSSVETYNELLEISKHKLKDKISSNIYREPYSDDDEIRSKVEDQLAISYFNKCAYCERLQKADIEHYRPKASVKDVKHNGYYWLCYEWTNLLPACVKCNRDGAKLTHFPILGKRVKNPSFLANGQLDLSKSKANNRPLKDEIPMLLHPEIDKPEDYFEFEIDSKGEGIRIKGKDALGRGEKTIEICRLNRQELRLARQQDIIDPFVEAINALFLKVENGSLTEVDFKNQIETHLETLKHNARDPKKTHTFLRNYIIENEVNFNKVVLHFMQGKIQTILLTAYKSARKNGII